MAVASCTAWFLTILAASSAFAADAERFVISQANPQLPVMTGYLDIVDAAGQPVTGLTAANLSATLGANTVSVNEIKRFEETGEGVAYVFLVDISKSISPAQFKQMQAAIQTWIGGLKSGDRAAISTFGEDYALLKDFTADKQALAGALDGLAPRDMHTRLYMAIDRAVELERRVDSGLPPRRVIVLLSDGKDEGSAITAEDVLLKVRASHLPIYGIGYSHLPRAEKGRFLDVLHRFSNVSGGLYKEAGSESMQELYKGIQQAILRVFVVRLSCFGCPADGRSYPLQITFMQGDRGLKDTLYVVPSAARIVPPPAEIPWWRKVPVWAWALAGLAVIAAAVLGLARRKRTEAAPSTTPLDIGTQASPGSFPSVSTDSPALPGTRDGVPLKLTVVKGKDAGQSHEFRLSDRAVIGRAGDCDVVVADPKVSNRHCEMALIHGQVLIYDLDSTNSTYVNGVPIRGRDRLETRDMILVGDTEMRVHFEET
jgi:von Willebrand factor type A domain/Inner membrane component of T3SS, cytoplasmic domain